MRNRTNDMDKRTERLSALANLMIVCALIGLAICYFAENKWIGCLGIILVAVGFLTSISFESLAEISANEYVKIKENQLKYASEQLDFLRDVNYSFHDYVNDNGCTMAEFVMICDEQNRDVEEIYNHYEHCGEGIVIQTKNQVRSIIEMERRRAR